MFVQNDRVANIQANTTGDIELICTGAQMKWISLSLTEELGRFVFVDAPDDYSDIALDNLCPQGTLADHKFASDTSGHTGLIQFVVFRQFIARLLQRPYTFFAYQKALSRAPPVI